MLNRKTPDTLAIDLTIKAPGAQETVEVVFNNRTVRELQAFVEDANKKPEARADSEWANREAFIYLVKTFNGVTPTHEGILTLEDNWPGSVVGIFHKYHEARRCEVVKN